MAKITVLGAGGWGIALALAAHKNNNEVSIWSPMNLGLDILLEKRTNERLLKDIYIPEDILLTDDINVCEGNDITVIAVPSGAVREVAGKLSAVKNAGVIVNVAKGFEKDTLKLLSDVIGEELPNNPLVVLTGPSHAEEVARDIPTSIVAASCDEAAAVLVQQAFSNENMRVYTNSDVVGAEIGGALKNVIAICVGFCNGLGLGDNTKAALITRGLAEMSRLGTAMGGEQHTFAGLTGIGDLVVTCMSQHSRNNRFGTLVGGGTPVDEALKEVGTVEGYYAAENAYKLSGQYNTEMPIIEQCYKVLYEGKAPLDTVKDLMNRPITIER